MRLVTLFTFVAVEFHQIENEHDFKFRKKKKTKTSGIFLKKTIKKLLLVLKRIIFFLKKFLTQTFFFSNSRYN
jgi:hypothetical protein